jgi:type I restriction enzyme R subunit
MAAISENEIEEIALSYLQNLGYSYILGTTLSPDGEHPERQYTDVVLATRLRDAIDKLNPSITQDAKEDALKKVLRTESPNALINNETFHKYLTEGVDVEVRTADGIEAKKCISLILPMQKTTSFWQSINSQSLKAVKTNDPILFCS